MKPMLTKKKLIGWHPDLQGDCSGLWGDCSDLQGDCSGLRGNCSGLWGDCSDLQGDCSGLSGDLDACDITDDDRRRGVVISSLVMPESQPNEQETK